MNEALSKGDQARAEILAAAQELFLSNGFHGTSMRAIAQAAGNRAVAGIYNHFPTKEAIFAALLEECNPYEQLFETLEGALAESQTAQEFVRRVLRGVLDFMPQYYGFMQLAQIDLREFEGGTIRHLLETRFMPRIAGVVQRVMMLPGLGAVEPAVWVRTVASLVIGFVITEQIIPMAIFGNYSHAEWADRLADVLLYGVADARPNEPPSPKEE